MSVNPSYGGTAELQGADETLTIASTMVIEGVGTIGDDQVGHDKLAIVNHGLIEATPEGGSNGLLFEGSGSFTNDGTLAAAVGGALTIAVTSVANSTGVISVDDAASSVIVRGSSIVGGTLENSAGGSFSTAAGATLDGATAGSLTISAASVISALDGTTTNIVGSIVDKGTIEIFGGNDENGYLNLTGATTLSGAGDLVMSVNPAYGGSAVLEGDGQTLTVTAAFTIEGAGIIGNGALTVHNSGVIEATPEDQSTTLTLNGTGGVFNQGTMEAQDGATLAIAGVQVTNTGGSITVADASSAVSISGATLIGGTLNNTEGGSFTTSAGATLDGLAGNALTISSGSVIVASNAATTNIEGSLVIDGLLQVVGGNDRDSYLDLVGSTTLSGTGDLELIQYPAYGGEAHVQGDGLTLTISSTMTVEGEGEIGDGSLAIVNNGAIIAQPESDTGGLKLDGTGGVINNGVLEATGGGHLSILAPLSGAGSLSVGAASELELGAGVGAGQDVNFSGSGAELRLVDAASYAGILRGFSVGETLDLAGINAVSATPTYNGSVTTLMVALSGGGNLQFSMAGDYSGDTFAVSHSGSDSSVYLVGEPAISAPSSVSETTGGVTPVANVFLSEPAASVDQTYTVSLSDLSGLLSATGAGVSGAGTDDLLITGSLAQVNADLSTLTVQEGGATSDTITINATDGLGYSAAPSSISVIELTPPQPTIAVPNSAYGVVGLATPIRGVSVSETGATASETFTVTVSDYYGNLGVHSGSGASLSGAGTNELTLVGSLGQVNAALSGIDDTLGSDTGDWIQVTVEDSFGQSAGPQWISLTPSTANNWFGVRRPRLDSRCRLDFRGRAGTR